MSSPEYEGFGMTDNDVMDAMDPLRRQRKTTRERQTYGMWADDDDDSEDGFGASDRNKQAKKDFSRPVAFVSRGVANSGDQSKKDEDDNDDDDVVEIESRGRPSTSSMRPRQGAVREPTGVKRVGAGVEFGEWARLDDKGMKLLKKMGYKVGQGLGKHGQGITEPIDAYVRKGKGALGYYGTERVEATDPAAIAALTRKVGSATEKKPRLEDVPEGPRLGQWKKSANEKKRVNYVVKTIADIAAEGTHRQPTRAVAPAATAQKGFTVIDLTGKEKRVYTNYAAISKHHRRPGEEPIVLDSDEPVKSGGSYFSVPELTVNLNLIVRSTEDEIISNLRRKDRAADQVIVLKNEIVRLEETIADEQRAIERVKEVMQLMEELEKADNLAEATQLLLRLRDDYSDEYKLHGLNEMAINVLGPLFRKHLKGWDPLVSTTTSSEDILLFQAVNQMRDLFINSNDGTKSAEIYQELFWEAWMPPVRQAIFEKWNPRDPENLIAMLESWQPLLPPWIWKSIQDQILVPRLMTEAENWNPITDTLPIHTWIHPWLGLLAEKLQPIYHPIKQKIGAALVNWHPSDPSAKLVISVWNGVWSEGTMRGFVQNHIVPKLARCLQQDLAINPRNENLGPWHWVLDWESLVPHPVLVKLIVENFFPKWLPTVASWLDTPNCDYGEVSKWYLGWKSMFPPALLQDPSIEENLAIALNMMSHAIGGGRAIDVLRPPMPPMIPPVPPPPMMMAPGPPRPHIDYSAMSTAPSSFKELIERRSQELGLTFVPLPGRSREGKQVYQLGRLQIFIDRNVVFMLTQQQAQQAPDWVPVAFQRIFELAV